MSIASVAAWIVVLVDIDRIPTRIVFVAEDSLETRNQGEASAAVVLLALIEVIDTTKMTLLGIGIQQRGKG